MSPRRTWLRSCAACTRFMMFSASSSSASRQLSEVDAAAAIGLIYENIEKLKKFEPKYRLKRTGLGGEKSGPGRRAKKDTKNRMKKARGKDKAKAGSKKWEKVQETQEPLDPHGKTSHELARMDWRQFRFRLTCNPAGSCRSIPIIHVKVSFSQLSNWTSMVPASSLGFVYQIWCI